MFTGHEFAEGGDFILAALEKEDVRASFFFTGDFYRNKAFAGLIRKLDQKAHYLGAHSDKHLLYCDWNKRDSLLVTRNQFRFDLADNYTAMARLGLKVQKSAYFLPPYEWYNDRITTWTKELRLQLISYTPGTRSHADYTTRSDKNYLGSEKILQSIYGYEQKSLSGLNGFILLLHIGAGPRREDKFYHRLPELLRYLKTKGYQFQRVDDLLKPD